MKSIEVVAGIIWNDEQSAILIARRPQHLHKGGYWEFPGGKIEVGESAEAALARELAEELSLQFSRSTFFAAVDFSYPEKSVSLKFYEVFGLLSQAVANEGQEWCWVKPSDLPQFQFPEANQKIVDALIARG